MAEQSSKISRCWKGASSLLVLAWFLDKKERERERNRGRRKRKREWRKEKKRWCFQSLLAKKEMRKVTRFNLDRPIGSDWTVFKGLAWPHQVHIFRETHPKVYRLRCGLCGDRWIRLRCLHAFLWKQPSSLHYLKDDLLLTYLLRIKYSPLWFYHQTSCNSVTKISFVFLQVDFSLFFFS